MLPYDPNVFQTAAGSLALEKYAAVTRLSIRVYDRDRRIIAEQRGSNRLFELLTTAREPRIVSECLERCFAQPDRMACVCVEHEHGLALVGAPFTNQSEVVCVSIAGYALTGHIDQLQLRRLAQESGLSFESLWRLVRSEVPTPVHRLELDGELLKIIGDTVISEHFRAQQLGATLAELEAANRSKDDFLATLSHELRAPLNVIRGWSQMLRAGKLDSATTVHALETIERNTDAQTRLVNDLLDISRIIAGKLSLEVEPVDLISLIEVVIDSFRVLADAKRIRLDVELDRTVPPTSGDPERLRQIFFNLFSNALKFTPPGGNVSVKLARLGSETMISVSDTGQGISPDFLPYVFDRFRQAESSTTRQHGGLGLGLAIVRHLVELHGGTVSALSSGDGQGDTFSVTLPLLKLPLNRAENDLLSSPHGDPGQLGGLRVWIVDDSATGRRMLKHWLEMNGAQVTVMASASEALKTLDVSTPEVLLSDVGMPGMDGYSLIREVRARGSEHGGNVPAIALSGYATPEDRERALAAGFQLHMAKPLKLDEVVRAIASLTGAAKSLVTDAH
jgi:signal transduction histidine kinase/CheY-like chemotaxis protein